MAVKQRILIVDDNEKLCGNLADILELKGYEVSVVFDGYEAIDTVKKGRFDAILMDVKMPGLSGIDTLKILKQISPGTAVIMITAFANDVFFREGLKSAELKVIQKPIDIDKFLVTLENVIAENIAKR